MPTKNQVWGASWMRLMILRQSWKFSEDLNFDSSIFSFFMIIWGWAWSWFQAQDTPCSCLLKDSHRVLLQHGPSCCLCRSSHWRRGPLHLLTLGLTPPVPWPHVQSGPTESVFPRFKTGVGSSIIHSKKYYRKDWFYTRAHSEEKFPFVDLTKEQFSLLLNLSFPTQETTFAVH